MINQDRNLLYGLLVRLFGFASPAAVRSGLDASAADPDKPLGQILTEQGSILPDQCAAVDRLLAEYLSCHEGDASICLSALADLPTLHGELSQLADIDAESRPVDDKTRSPATLTLVTAGEAREEADPQSPSGSRFRILRPHARGGLGEAFIAHDHELRREVALKQLHDRHADVPGTRARFMLEAEVTGGLEHPGIVPVYSLGRDPEGRPYYAMRFIRGDSLKQAVDQFHRADRNECDPGERALALRKLLRRFIDVCNAIEYAHSRGVIHRDLKPDNIMLGTFGETLVVDWGLAKPLKQVVESEASAKRPLETSHRGDTTRTQVGSAVGTPAFMSPEQAAGQLDQMGPASDVYSLGATLYYLLTGRPPIEDSGLLKLLIRVQEGDFPRPREINPDTPAALQAICLKAMALAPSDRYPSARALAEDVDRWLADEPVTAYRAAWNERLARWGRRHRRSVEVGAAALIVVAVVSIVAAVLVHGAKREVEQERDEVRLALEAEKSAKLQAHAALEAERTAKNEARRAIDNYVQLVSEDDSLKDEQMQPLRRQLLEDARRYYQQLIDKDGHDAHVRHDLANAILRVGRLSNIGGSKHEAIDAFQQARTAFQELVEAHPDELKYRSDLALCYRSLGVLENEIGTPEKALASFRQSLRISAAVAAALAAGPLSASRSRELFEVACDLARCAPERLDSDAERALARQADAAAVHALHDATAAGFQFDRAAERRLKNTPWDSVPQFKAAIDALHGQSPVAETNAS